MRQLKATFYQQADLPLERAMDMALDKFVGLTSTADSKEGLAAFFEKRSPVWKGR
jgi:enoyl-CoA hydratase/carnithine racemase